MKAEIIKLTPELASELLKKNVNNRKLKIGLKFLIHQMNNGEWKENGEAIILDKNGFVKDGQHRLHAVIAANYSYHVPLITDVESDVMDTIDTGFNRSLGDILQLNGFKYSIEISSIVRSILAFDFEQYYYTASKQRDTKNYISNSRGLNYAMNYKIELEKLANISKNIYDHQFIKVLQMKDIGLYLYILARYEYERDHIDFVKRITGNGMIEGTAAYWLFRKLASAKKDKIHLNKKWKIYAMVKAWNNYVGGDIPINRMMININNTLDKVAKL